MILTGSKIITEWKKGNISIYPFNKNQVNPNSYNYRLGSIIKQIDNNNNQIKIDLKKYPDGFVLKKNTLYLGVTYEKLGSKIFAMSLIGRSSLGRMGLFLQISANLGHVKSNHRWTLEIIACNDIIIYNNMIIGQISFWKNDGVPDPNPHKYNNYNFPAESLGIEYDIDK